MSDTVMVALITSVGSLIAACVAAFLSHRNGKKIEAVHLEINSRLTKLIEASIDSGRIAERNEHIARKGDAGAPGPRGEKGDKGEPGQAGIPG